MDLIGVRDIRVPTTRSEVVFGDGDIPLGGGTWLYSEAQEGVTGLVDLTGLGWPAITFTDHALVVAATCTVAELSRLPAGDGWTAHPLILQCVHSFLASFKIWNMATVGGNICTALPAGPMISLAVALDAHAVVWTADGGERTLLVADLVTGVRTTSLQRGEVLRSIEFPLATLTSRTAFRRIALSPLGRSGTLVIGRVDPGGATVFAITAATHRPHQLRFAGAPDAAELAHRIDEIDDWYWDPHGTPDWRRAMSVLLAEEIRVELGSDT